MKTFKQYINENSSSINPINIVEDIKVLLKQNKPIPDILLKKVSKNTDSAYYVANLYMINGLIIPQILIDVVTNKDTGTHNHEYLPSEAYYLMLNGIIQTIQHDTYLKKNRIPIELLEKMDEYSLKRLGHSIKHIYNNKPKELTEFLKANKWAIDLVI